MYLTARLECASERHRAGSALWSAAACCGFLATGLAPAQPIPAGAASRAAPKRHQGLNITRILVRQTPEHLTLPQARAEGPTVHSHAREGVVEGMARTRSEGPAHQECRAFGARSFCRPLSRPHGRAYALPALAGLNRGCSSRLTAVRLHRRPRRPIPPCSSNRDPCNVQLTSRHSNYGFANSHAGS